MPTGASLHIGLNAVDPKQYSGWDGQLTACEFDANDWLLDGTADGHERVLYYSGHGAQLPDYNPAERIDHVDECLVPYDFHWTQGRAITDDDFLRYYSALPYAAKFFAIFDCCHCGGLTRDGARKIRAIIPPGRYPAPNAALQQGRTNVGGARSTEPQP